MKICVYAICKNESKFVDRWVDSMSEADSIHVLDTGSSDDTVTRLQKRGVHVESREINPWRFDVARNLSLDMVPQDADVCVCTDLDEVFEKGWREKVENSWQKSTTRARYNFNWSFDEHQRPAVSFYIEKMHTRHNYRWHHPVHEILQPLDGTIENIITIKDITVNHYPDLTKPRTGYLPLLELSVKENPEDDRNMHYLGREYMYYERWNDCIDTLIKHLHLKTATWKDERSASMRFIARAYTALERYDEARMWLDKAIEETPYLRDPYIERAILEYNLKNYQDVIKYGNESLKITTHAKTYINEVFSWNNTIYDLLSIAYYYLHDKDNALKNVDIALKMEPNDERLKHNKELFEQMS